MPEAHFSLNISAAEVEKYYRGQAQTVLVTTHQGLKVQFPANLILPHITRAGVQGEFVLDYQTSGKANFLSRL